jgi:phytoene desaturase
LAKKAVIIGSGFAGLSAACFLAKAGWQVTVLEKHNGPGGRARQLIEDGFTFDMGPSWYWMPDVFEKFFAAFGKKVTDYYTLQRLNPSYRVYWPDTVTDIPADYPAFKQLFEQTEPGSGVMLDKFLQEAAYKYQTGINKLVYKPGLSLGEFADIDLLKGVVKLDVFQSMKKHVHKYFRHPQLQQLLEFPVLFLGALPENTPALYSLMNYADIMGGTWYPQGGMYSIVHAMYSLASELGVNFCFNEEVQKIVVENGVAKSIVTLNKTQQSTNAFYGDAVLGGADYHHIETKLLEPQYRSYTPAYWNKRVMAPGSLIYFVGLNKRLNNITHHTLFFDTSFAVHGQEIYTSKKWPTNPLFYVSATSVTDDAVAPADCENLFFLIPVAAGLLDDDETLREKYFDLIIKRFEERVGEPVKKHIVYKKTFANSDFVSEYNSFKGNAYGLANTLLQTAILKPSCRSKKVKNLFYAGQLTVPGPGVPPSIISGEVAAMQIIKNTQ